MEIEKGYKVFITGAGSGIGRATSLAISKFGTRLFLSDINQNGLDKTVELITEGGGEVCRYKALDVSDLNQVKEFAGEIHRDFGPMHIVMNIAGIALFALIEDMSHSHWQKVINVNLWGPIHIIECFLPEMIRAKRGHLVNVASIAGLTGAPWHSAYSASKFGLVGLSEVLRYDLFQHNIGVTLICPGAVETPLKNTVEILGVDTEGEDVKEAKRRFSEFAIPPERVASQIINAIQKNRFLVITSFDVRFLYFCKHHLFPLYHYFMKSVSRLLNSGRYPKI